jgi:glycosyltransferase involved in cell wall biosynthesis
MPAPLARRWAHNGAMRVLHLIQRYWPAVGGAETHLREISKRLANDGHDVTIATTDVAEITGFSHSPHAVEVERESTIDGVRVRRFPIQQPRYPSITTRVVRRLMAECSRWQLASATTLKRMASFALSAPALDRWIAGEATQFDVIAAMGIGYESLYWPALDIARAHQRPFLMYPLIHFGERQYASAEQSGHHARRRWSRPEMADYYTMRHQIAMLRASSTIFAQTTIEADFLRRRSMDEKQITLAGVGVEPELVRGGNPARARAQLGVDAPFVLVLGTQSVDKGTPDLLEAMHWLWARGGTAHLVLAGAVQPDSESQIISAKLQRADRIHVLGVVSDEQKRDLLAACAILALPSRADSFGIVLLEAWLNEKPVVVARAGGLPAVVDAGSDGLLVPYGDPTALADALCRLLDNESLALAFGRAGQAKVLARYTWNSIYPIIRNVYERYATQLS